MPASLTPQQAYFLKTYLGVELPVHAEQEDAAAGIDARALRSAISEWRDALDEVNAQISALQSVLKASGDPQLAEIAEYGVNGVTGNYKVRVQAAMVDLSAAPDAALPDKASKALPEVRALLGHITSAKTVAACDENPFGINVSIRKTLGGALELLAREMQALAA